MKPVSVPWWVRGDWNGFFGLFTNSLTNIMVLAGLLSMTLKMPDWLVYGRVLPAVGVSLAVGNLYYAFMARRLARREGRTDVTALPYGVSVPHMFIVVFLIVGPIYWKTGDPLVAWRAGVAWCFIEAVVEVLGAAVGPTVRKYTPRAAMLGTLAGVSLTYIAMRPAMQSWEVPYIAMVSLTVILMGWFARKRFPGDLPAGLVAIIAGTILGWATGYMRPEAVAQTVASIRPAFPVPAFSALAVGMREIAPYLATAIPLAVYNFFETMNNVESACAAGDDYNTREAMLVDGLGSLTGALLGSMFPTAVYIGHPGWKSVGARIGYSVATGVGALVVCLLGVVPLLLTVIPLVAVLPILLYIGLVIGAQAFQASPSRHAPAVVMGMVPWLANWGQSLVDNALSAVGSNAGLVGYGRLLDAGIVYRGMEVLGGGAIIVGMILAAVTAFVIDHRFREASIYAFGAAVLSYFGIIHSGRIAVGAATGPAVGYLLMAAVCLLMSRLRSGERPEGGEGDTVG
ncbi:MAG: hypothetical protein H5U04_09845 [Firmicutes bacterium]|nr:hypothetical protein [Bacillota bacterium]